MLQLNQAHTPIQHLLIDLIFLSVSVPVCSLSDVILLSIAWQACMGWASIFVEPIYYSNRFALPRDMLAHALPSRSVVSNGC